MGGGAPPRAMKKTAASKNIAVSPRYESAKFNIPLPYQKKRVKKLRAGSVGVHPRTPLRIPGIPTLAALLFFTKVVLIGVGVCSILPNAQSTRLQIFYVDLPLMLCYFSLFVPGLRHGRLFSSLPFVFTFWVRSYSPTIIVQFLNTYILSIML